MKNKSLVLEDLPGLKKEYKKAVSLEKKEFTYVNVQGDECLLVTDYAKYLIQYMES